MSADYKKAARSILALGVGTAQLAPNNTQYLGANSLLRAAEANAQFDSPVTCILARMYVVVDIPPGGVDTLICTVMINGIASTLTVTITGAALRNSDIVNAEAIEEGDSLSVRCVSSATAAAMRPQITMQVLNAS